MKQYLIKENTIVLSVKKAPIFVRATMFFFAFALFFLPLIGITVGIISGKEFRIGLLFALVVFGLIGFFTLRMALWNAYGKEIIKLNLETIEYEADYGWFKDGKKVIGLKNPLLSINPIGYEEDKKGTLIINDDNEKITTAVKMPITQIEELIERINTVAHKM